MGVVYKARDPLIGRLVALKTINSSFVDRPRQLERFYQEAQSAGKLQHPNIVTIFELGQEKDTPFIAMEYLDGKNLETTIRRQTDLLFALKIGYIVQICRALEYAHKKREVHRDIKPSNIMVTSEGVVKVVDFGIARLVDFSRTHTNTMIGTPTYMAPELFRKNRADERSDIWAVGVTFYELICSQRPFTGDSYDLIRSIVEDDFPPPSSIAAECSPDLEAVIRHMLQKRPADRYRSMGHVLLHLEPIWNRLRSDSAATLAQRARELYDLGELAKAQDALRRACEIDSANKPVKSLLERVTAELRGSQALPRAGEHLEPQGESGHLQREIQQRVREIRFKIACQEFSDAIDIARQTLTTLGPDADISKLLQAAEVEAREAALLSKIELPALPVQAQGATPNLGAPSATPEGATFHARPDVAVLTPPPASPAKSSVSQAQSRVGGLLPHIPSAPEFRVFLRKPAVWTVAALLLSMTSWAGYHFLVIGVSGPGNPARASEGELKLEVQAERLWQTRQFDQSEQTWQQLAQIKGPLQTEAIQRVSEIEQKRADVQRRFHEGESLLKDKQDYASAQQAFDDVIQLNLWHADDAVKELAVAKQALGMGANLNQEKAHFDQGVQLFQNKQYDKARQEFRAALDLNVPDSPYKTEAKNYINKIRASVS